LLGFSELELIINGWRGFQLDFGAKTMESRMFRGGMISLTVVDENRTLGREVRLHAREDVLKQHGDLTCRLQGINI